MPTKTTAPASTVSNVIGAPATKYITPQQNSTKAAWPKSGCSARSATMIAVSAKDQVLPGGPPISWLAAISQAATTTKPGLRNSDGCTEAKPSEYQRTAPLPKSVPSTGSSASAANAARKPSVASRRTSCGDIIDRRTITAIATPPKNACRVT